MGLAIGTWSKGCFEYCDPMKAASKSQLPQRWRMELHFGRSGCGNLLWRESETKTIRILAARYSFKYSKHPKSGQILVPISDAIFCPKSGQNHPVFGSPTKLGSFAIERVIKNIYIYKTVWLFCLKVCVSISDTIFCTHSTRTVECWNPN